MTTHSSSSDETDRQTISIEEFLAIRKAEGLKIDARTADVTWWYAQVLDPYDIYNDVPPEYDCVGREYFAQAPESDIWVLFGDLPDQTREALWEANKRELAFPAGFGGRPSR